MHAALAALATAGLVMACQPGVTSAGGSATASVNTPMAELWVEPEPNRDLYWGVGGKRLAPDPAARYTVIEIKRGGFSRGYTVTDPDDREWSVKFPPEAAPEVAASRLLWGVGYHQPPVYYLAEWHAEKATSPNPQLPARFRESKPDLRGLDAQGTWSYSRNPFAGTPQMNGLLVLHAMLGNSDLKDEQNALYVLHEPMEGARRWYVARDLGQSFGRTGMLDPPRGDIDVFEQTSFIKGVENGHVRFEYSGRHKGLFERITPADVRWICKRLAALDDRQMRDAFRAAGYPDVIGGRFVRRLEQKIAEGLALKD
ncbi:MAG: hypothetical protein ACRD1U_07710 [Vicinamibacterales bacterium]